MSNRTRLEPTKFRDIRTGEITYGFRMWDDHIQGYRDDLKPLDLQDDIAILQAATEGVLGNYCDPIEVLLESIRQNREGIIIAGTWYEWAQIKHVFQTNEAEPGHGTGQPGPSGKPTLIGIDTAGPDGDSQG